MTGAHLRRVFSGFAIKNSRYRRPKYLGELARNGCQSGLSGRVEMGLSAEELTFHTL